jgi:hypothetical protein
LLPVVGVCTFKKKIQKATSYGWHCYLRNKKNIQVNFKMLSWQHICVPLNPRSMQELNAPFFAFRISARAAKAPKRK